MNEEYTITISGEGFDDITFKVKLNVKASGNDDGVFTYLIANDGDVKAYPSTNDDRSYANYGYGIAYDENGEEFTYRYSDGGQNVDNLNGRENRSYANYGYGVAYDENGEEFTYRYSDQGRNVWNIWGFENRAYAPGIDTYDASDAEVDAGSGSDVFEGDAGEAVEEVSSPALDDTSAK